jgi:putative phosphoesterase
MATTWGNNGDAKVRVGILSDTHGKIDHRIADIMTGCDVVIHAGDIGNKDILTAITPSAGGVVAVLGNNDTRKKWPRGEHSILKRLAEQECVSLPGGDVAIEHGHRIWDTKRCHERLRRKYPEVTVIVYGHTHKRRVDRSCKPWVVNPGAAGRARTFGGPSCLVLSASKHSWRIREYSFDLQPHRGVA